MALTLTGVAWLTTLAVNANPFMRYDAYYILSDLFEMPMLQTRAFAMAKWFLRKKALGLRNGPPEPMSPRAAALCVAYSYCTWMYRFFLFLGIAFLVYHMFFKALGLALFMVEIGDLIFLSFAERRKAAEACDIDVFDPSAIEAIL